MIVECKVLDNFIKDAASLNDFKLLRHGTRNSVSLFTYCDSHVFVFLKKWNCVFMPSP